MKSALVEVPAPPARDEPAWRALARRFPDGPPPPAQPTFRRRLFLDELFFELKSELSTLFEVEQLTLYAIDREKRELYSKYLLDPLDGVQEIRVPINDASISGYCARYGKIVNIADAYDAAELATINPRLSFDPSWDKRSGFRSRQMLAVPILVERKYLMGVLLLINKRSGDRFTVEEEGFASDIAETLGLALRNQSQVVQR